MDTGKLNAGDNPVIESHLIKWGVDILLVESCYRNQYTCKLQLYGPLSPAPTSSTMMQVSYQNYPVQISHNLPQSFHWPTRHAQPAVS